MRTRWPAKLLKTKNLKLAERVGIRIYTRSRFWNASMDLAKRSYRNHGVPAWAYITRTMRSGQERAQLRSSASKGLLYRAQALAKPNRQRFDGHLAFGHGECRLHQFVRRRQKSWPLIRRNTIAPKAATRLLPSTNGWFSASECMSAAALSAMS